MFSFFPPLTSCTHYLSNAWEISKCQFFCILCWTTTNCFISVCSCALSTGGWPSFTTQDRSTTSEWPPATLKAPSSWWTIRYRGGGHTLVWADLVTLHIIYIRRYPSGVLMICYTCNLRHCSSLFSIFLQTYWPCIFWYFISKHTRSGCDAVLSTSYSVKPHRASFRSGASCVAARSFGWFGHISWTGYFVQTKLIIIVIFQL